MHRNSKPSLHNQGGGTEPRWGEASSEESEGEVAHYIGRRREVLEAGGTVLADAAPEFGSLAAVKARLEAWKRAHPGDAPPFCASSGAAGSSQAEGGP